MDEKLFQEELTRIGGEAFTAMFFEFLARQRQEKDEYHLANLKRLKAIEETQAETTAAIKELAGVIGFVRDSRVTLRWAGRFGKFIIGAGKFITAILAIYGGWKWFGGWK